MEILLVTTNPNKFDDLIQAMTEQAACRFTTTDTMAAALDALKRTPPDLMIIDDPVGETGCLEIARNAVMTNAMVNLAVVSELSDDAFHDAAEGLGIMARISKTPDRQDAELLLDTLKVMPSVQ